jgi:GT2 family glycosyltransferase
MNDISIIILNYNSSDFTIKCVESIIKHTAVSIKYDIIIVDNNSRIEEYDKIVYLDNAVNIKLIRSNVNLGFGGGNTLGYEYSNSKYIFFLNNDCELVNDNISILYNFMERNPNVALCSGQMYSPEMKLMKSVNYIPTLSLKLLGNSTLRYFKPEKYPSTKKEYFSPIKVESLAGASMFFRTEHFTNIGGFDLDYFLYCEEEDLAQELSKKDYDTYLVPEAKYIHHLSKSTELNYKSEREFFISLMHFFRKHNNILIYNLLKLFYFIKLLRKFYKSTKYIKLAFFVIAGASQKHSLRHEQTINKG